MRRTLATLALTAVLALAGASLGGIASGPQAAAETTEATFIVPAADGYGVADCLLSGAPCGQIVADAWCSSQGFARARGFGREAPDETASIRPAATSARAEPPVVVTCIR